MVKTKVNWPTHLRTTLLALLNCSQLDLDSQSKLRSLKMKSSTLHKMPAPSLSVWISTVSLTSTLQKQQMKKNHLLRKLFWTKTSVNQSALPLTVKPMLPKQMVKMEQANWSVTCISHLHLFKQMARPSVRWLKLSWWLMETSGKMQILTMVKMVFTTQNKQKKSLRKRNLHLKQMVWNSQFTWICQ